MTTSDSVANSASVSRPPRRFRIFQFSIRTLLLLTAAVAIFCNWYFQPQRKDEDLAGGMLKLRRQVRVEMRDPPSFQSISPQNPQVIEKVATFISHGKWSLMDKNENLLARGQYANDVPTGSWTVWYTNGNKAAEGKVKEGAKTGRWRTWYEGGTLQSEVNYAADVKESLAKGWSGTQFARKKRAIQAAAFPREGRARAWHAGGKLKFDGTYQDDLEEGPWKLYDEQGNVMAAGTYHRGKRHGTWTILDENGRQTKVEYTHGRQADELKSLLAKLTEKLHSKNPTDRLRAAGDLAELGEDAVPVLTKALAHESQETRIAAVRAILRIGDDARPALPDLQELAAAVQDSPLKTQAMLTVYVLDPPSREKYLEPLAAHALASGDAGEAQESLSCMFTAAEEHQPKILGHVIALEGQHEEGQSSLLGQFLANSDADSLTLLADAYDGQSLAGRTAIAYALSHLTQRGQAWTRTASGVNVHPRFEALAKKIAEESDPELKQIGEQILARQQDAMSRSNGSGRGGFF